MRQRPIGQYGGSARARAANTARAVQRRRAPQIHARGIHAAPRSTLASTRRVCHHARVSVAIEAPPTSWLNLELVDSAGTALADRPYTLQFDDGVTEHGALDERGRLQVRVPAGARTAQLVVAYRRFALTLGGLPAPETVAGAQERLNHLNFFTGPVDGDAGPMTRSAIASFQRQAQLPDTGLLDADTATALRRAHGS